MPYITEQEALQHSIAEAKFTIMQAQLDSLIDGLDDVLLILQSGAADEIKVLRIEEILTTAICEAASLEETDIPDLS